MSLEKKERNLKIWEDSKSGLTIRKLCKKYSLSIRTVWDIVNRYRAVYK